MLGPYGEIIIRTARSDNKYFIFFQVFKTLPKLGHNVAGTKLAAMFSHARNIVVDTKFVSSSSVKKRCRV